MFEHKGQEQCQQKRIASAKIDCQIHSEHALLNYLRGLQRGCLSIDHLGLKVSSDTLSEVVCEALKETIAVEHVSTLSLGLKLQENLSTIDDLHDVLKDCALFAIRRGLRAADAVQMTDWKSIPLRS